MRSRFRAFAAAALVVALTGCTRAAWEPTTASFPVPEGGQSRAEFAPAAEIRVVTYPGGYPLQRRASDMYDRLSRFGSWSQCGRWSWSDGVGVMSVNILDGDEPRLVVSRSAAHGSCASALSAAASVIGESLPGMQSSGTGSP